MTEREHPPVDSHEVATLEAVLDQPVTEAEIEQLTARDHAMLRLCESPD